MVAIPTLVTDHACCPARVKAIHKTNNSTNASTSHHGDSVSKITGTTTATIMANPNPSLPMNEPISATRQRIYNAQAHAPHRRQCADHEPNDDHERQATEPDGRIQAREG
jgi:hypothetical protein